MTVTVVVLFLAKELKFVSYPEASREIPKKVSRKPLGVHLEFTCKCMYVHNVGIVVFLV